MYERRLTTIFIGLFLIAIILGILEGGNKLWLIIMMH